MLGGYPKSLSSYGEKGGSMFLPRRANETECTARERLR